MSLIGARVGDYLIKRLLGEGGVGEVYEATHEAIGGRVAIKVLREEQAQDPEWVTRLFDEARAVNLIAHDGLVKVVHYGQLDDGRPYLVMEFVSGQTLDARLQGGRLTLQEILHIGYQMALALQAAHAAGIVHRDLKPSNLMLGADPAALGGVRVKILDFGIAKLPRGDRAQRTQTGVVFGTPAYMPPEQFRGTSQVDARGDVYSLGVLLYELFAGQRPFEHDEPVAYMYSHCNRPPPPLAERAPGLSSELLGLVERMLAKDRLARPDMAEVAASLGTQLSTGASPAPQPLVSTPTGLPTVQLPSTARRSRLLAMVIVAGFVIGLSSSLVWVLVTPAREAAPQPDAGPATAPRDLMVPVAAIGLAAPALDLLSGPITANPVVQAKPTATKSPAPIAPATKPTSTAVRPTATKSAGAKQTTVPAKPTEVRMTTADAPGAPAGGSAADSKKLPALNPSYMPRTLQAK